MRNIKLTLEYEGSAFHGFQTQKNAKTIQEVLEKALSRLLREKIKVVSCSRTDSGVHAEMHVINFKSKTRLRPGNILGALNKALPKTIAVTEAEYVPASFHSRFDARSKTYRYTVLNRKARPSLYSRYVYRVRSGLKVSEMKKEARDLVGRHDFKAFCASGAGKGSTVRTIKEAKIGKKGDYLFFEIRADGFLYNMVRSIVGTLIEVGRGRFERGRIKAILSEKKRSMTGPTVPAKGLCLIKVDY
jgi:tRNA pseudouridine38-40 synthase